MGKKRIVILGAGLCGLSTAWHLKRKKQDCILFEKEEAVGGLCRSKTIDGFTFDYDGHLLHFRHPYTFSIIQRLMGNNLVSHQRNAWVYAFGRYIPYPFQANLYTLPPKVIKDCLLGLAKVMQNGSRHKKEISFLDWINLRFGRGIAQYFMEPYNRKFWTVSPQDLTCEWLEGFIPVPSPGQIIEGAIEKNKNEFGYNTRFWYPKKGGINQLALAFAHNIPGIRTDCAVSNIDLKRKEVITVHGDREKFDCLVSTVPLPELPRIVLGLPREVRGLFKKLRWNSILNLNLGIDNMPHAKKHWVYFPDKEVSFFRVGFHHNFSRALTRAGRGSLYVESSYSTASPIDKEVFVSRMKADLFKTGVLEKGGKILVEDINDIKYGYPIYDRNYKSTRHAILRFLCRHGVILAGRYGSWQYKSMEDVIWEGKKISESVSL